MKTYVTEKIKPQLSSGFRSCMLASPFTDRAEVVSVAGLPCKQTRLSGLSVSQITFTWWIHVRYARFHYPQPLKCDEQHWILCNGSGWRSRLGRTSVLECLSCLTCVCVKHHFLSLTVSSMQTWPVWIKKLAFHYKQEVMSANVLLQNKCHSSN